MFINSLSGHTQRKTTALLSNLLAYSQAFWEGWMKPQRRAAWVFLRRTGVSNTLDCADPNWSNLCSQRDLWEEKNVLEMQTLVQEHTSLGGMVSLRAGGRCFCKPTHTHTKGNLYQSLHMLGRGFWTSCFHNKPVYRKNYHLLTPACMQEEHILAGLSTTACIIQCLFNPTSLRIYTDP